MILEQCKGVHCVDLGESFQTHIFLQNLASMQPLERALERLIEDDPATAPATMDRGSRVRGGGPYGAAALRGDPGSGGSDTTKQGHPTGLGTDAANFSAPGPAEPVTVTPDRQFYKLFVKFLLKNRPFSAASAPSFASKYAFFSILKNLHHYQVDI